MKILKKIRFFIQELFSRFSENNISVFAAQATFFMIISAIPFFMLLLGFAKYFVPFEKSEILNAMSHFLPQKVYMLSTNIINELFAKTPGSLISITAITLLWSASRGILAIIRCLNSINNVPKSGFIKERLIAFLYTFLFVLVLVFTLIVLLIEKIVFRIFSLNFQVPILFFLLIILFSAIYAYLPKNKTTIKSQIPGAFLSSVCWVLFTWLYSLYIDNFSNFSYVYGSLAAIVLSMLWLYICMNIFLCGAEFNHIINNQKSKK